jgi:hypothetical protein
MAFKNIEDKKKYEQKYWLEVRKERKAKLKTILNYVCERCHCEYTANRVTQKYCSKTCQSAVHGKKKRDNNPVIKLAHNVRSRLRKSIKHKNAKSCALLGCSWNELKLHLESKFTKEMSWNNYGKYWEIDHIIRLANFDLTDPEQLKKACHYTNLQPLSINEHRKKSTLENLNV